MKLPTPSPGNEVAWTGEHLGDLCSDAPARSGRFAGTQAAADAALAAYDVTGYARRRNEVWPPERRGASGLSPWIRHGLLPLPTVWAMVDGPSADRRKFRVELRWQEYARHLYARLGTATAESLRYQPEDDAGPTGPWDRSMKCMDITVGELETDGWLVNQTRMWLASQWTVRHDARWQDGEDRFFTHLLDGSRAANRLGWQWTVGAGTGRPYGFSQWQVRKRAPSLCAQCELADACPIAGKPAPDRPPKVDADPRLRHDPDPDATGGPEEVRSTGQPEAVWITAESLGDEDPALAAHADLPVMFVFDQPLLSRLQLSSKRLIFLVDRLAELASDREVEVHLGRPVEVLADRRVAATFAPVPGWRRIATEIEVAETHPWPWLERPGSGPLGSFSAWRKGR